MDPEEEMECQNSTQETGENRSDNEDVTSNVLEESVEKTVGLSLVGEEIITTEEVVSEHAPSEETEYPQQTFATDLSMPSQEDETIQEVKADEEGRSSTPVMENVEMDFLVELLASEEYSTLSEDLKGKIIACVGEKMNKFVVAQALFHAFKTQHNEKFQLLELNFQAKLKEIEDLNKKWEDAKLQIDSLQEKLNEAQQAAERAIEDSKRMSYEWQDFKTQRDLACDEKESLLTMLERRDAEIATLTEEKAEIAQKLQNSIKAKIEALENAHEVESMRINLEYKEKRLDQENALLRSQVQSLTEEMEVKIMDLAHVRGQLNSQSMTLESELTAKTEEIRILTETVTDLRETNDKLTDRAEKLVEKISSQRQSYDAQIENFHQELTAQKKLAGLYKGISNENDTKTEKLTQANEELKKLLDTAKDRYGELENNHREKMLKMEHEISKRDECIQHLKRELQDANDLLQAAKEEKVEYAIGTLSPSAAAASRLIKSGMSLTQIYTQYARVSEELDLVKEENRRLNLYVTTIVKEIEEKAPILQQQRADYEKAVANAASLTKEMDKMITEAQLMGHECSEAKKLSNHLKRENERLKKELSDLARQVCYLVKAVEEARGGIVSHDTAYEMSTGSAQDVISKHLVTFASIEDLQENNQKLLSLLRQLSEKQETAESVSMQEHSDLLSQKEKLEQQVTELIEEMGRQSKMLDIIRSQSDTYKKLYLQAMGGEVPDFEMVEATAGATTPVKGSPQLVTSTPLPSSKVQPDSEALKKLQDANEKIEKLEKEIIETRQKHNEELAQLTAKLNKTTEEAREWLFKNSKLVAQAEYHEEKSKVLDANLKSLRKQVSALEERNKTIGEICAKHEQSICTLKEEAMESQRKLAKAEVQRDNLQQEVLILKTAEARLVQEREALNRERISNSLLLNNLEGLKATLERSEAEGKLRLELQLSEAVKECAALRNSLKDEKERCKEKIASFERQTASAKERVAEEKVLADKARADLDALKKDLEVKIQTINELNAQVRELKNQPVRSVIHTVSQAVDTSAQRVNELEKQLSESQAEISRLRIQLNSAHTSNQQYIAISEATQKQLEQLVQQHEICAQNLAERENLWKAEKAGIAEKLSEVTQERDRLLSERAELAHTASDETEEYEKKIEALKDANMALETELENTKDTVLTLNKTIAELKTEIAENSARVREIDSRYSQEVVAHSQAIQALDAVKKELEALRETQHTLQLERDAAKNAVAAKCESYEQQKEQAEEEIRKLQERLQDLDNQNVFLHTTLQKLNQELALVQAKAAAEDKTYLEASLNTSAELSEKAQDELIRVIKFLRQEKDIANTKSEVLQAESTRLKADIATLKKELDEVQSTLKKVEEGSQVRETAASKHSDLLRKVESLNAMTDSNRMLREERNRYKEEVTELKEKLAQYQVGINPLQAEITQLKKDVENANIEREAISLELERWKTRASILMERGKVSPEEWKKVNAERESLAKELEIQKSSNEKLEECAAQLRQEASALSDSVEKLKEQLVNETKERERINNELMSTRQKVKQIEGELVTARAEIQALTQQLAETSDQLKTKETTIAEMTAKESQIRKIAKKYKNQFETLQKSNEEEKKKREEEEAKKAEESQKAAVISEEEQEKLRGEGRAQAQLLIAEEQAKMSDEIKQLEARIASSNEETETLRKDNDALKASLIEKEDRAKQVLKSARSKIALQKEELDRSRDEVSSLKAHYDAAIARLEKERQEQVELANQEKERTASQIKTLNQRITQLQRALEKPIPSTSSQSLKSSTMEPPPTANIKPMAGSSTQRKPKATPVGPFWSGGNDQQTPFAMIGPVQTRMVAVQPTSLAGGTAGSSSGTTTGTASLMQHVHTTGNSGEAMSSSPTSSHTDYMPATSSATPIRVVVAPTPLNAQSTEEVEAENESMGPPSQTVAMVTPRVEMQPTPGPSSTANQANSSNTVTTTQAGLKRQRDQEDSTTEGDHKSMPQVKKARATEFMPCRAEGSVVEYQVPTSSQRDDDMVVMLVDSEEEGNADEGEAEEPDDCFEDDDNGDSYELEPYMRERQERQYEEGPDIDEDNPDDPGGNEVEIVDGRSFAPVPLASNIDHQQQSSEATSSGNNNSHHVVVSYAASSDVASFRTWSVSPLNRATPSLQGFEEGGDDSIVPSTPTLFLSRDTVSSPQVPHQRFTFSEPTAGMSRRDDVSGDESGRSVPNTPVIVLPPDPEQSEPSVPAASINPDDGGLQRIGLSGGQDDSQDSARRQDDREAPEALGVDDDGDGVTSEGEKPPAMSGEYVEEGREAEASEPVIRGSGTARRSARINTARRGGASRGRPTPIVWNEPGSSGLPSNQRAMNRGAYRGRPRRWQ